MDDNHTKAPWYCEGDAIYDNPDCAGSPIAHVLSCAYGADDNAVDARRIVACVNALPHLSTEALEELQQSGDKLVATSRYVGEARRERDQLLARVEVAEAGYQAAVQKAEWQARTNTELNALTLKIAKLTGSKDQLLAALEQFVTDFEGCYADHEPAMIQARAAIAAVKGGA